MNTAQILSSLDNQEYRIGRLEDEGKATPYELERLQLERQKVYLLVQIADKLSYLCELEER